MAEELQLVLTIEKAPDPAMRGVTWRCGSSGGTLGRSDRCDLTLPDPEMFTSSMHAEIEADRGAFRLIDRSTNGTFHNAPGTLIGKNRDVGLSDGDRLYIGDYVLRVDLEAEDAGSGYSPPPPPPPPPASGEVEPAAFGDPDEAPTGRRDGGSSDAIPDDDWDLDGFSDPWEDKDSATGQDVAPSKRDAPDERAYSQSPEREFFSPPSSASGKEEAIPEDWDDFLTGFDGPASGGGERQAPSESAASATGPESTPEPSRSSDRPEPAAFPREPATPAEPPAQAQDDPQPEPSAPRPPAPSPPADSSAGVEPQVFAPPSDSRAEKEPEPEPERHSEPVPRPGGNRPRSPAPEPEPPARSPGSPRAGSDPLEDMLRVVTEGLMALLKGRAEIKNEFRISQTRFAQTENNPLKFSPNADEAMDRVLERTAGSGFLTGSRAFEDALEDLQAHQLALLSAAQRAVESVIGQFDPKQLEARLHRISPLSAKTPGLKAAKCWNLFTVHYDEVAGKMREDARQMFLAEFAEAYEEACDQVVRARENASKS